MCCAHIYVPRLPWTLGSIARTSAPRCTQGSLWLPLRLLGALVGGCTVEKHADAHANGRSPACPMNRQAYLSWGASWAYFDQHRPKSGKFERRVRHRHRQHIGRSALCQASPPNFGPESLDQGGLHVRPKVGGRPWGRGFDQRRPNVGGQTWHTESPLWRRVWGQAFGIGIGTHTLGATSAGSPMFCRSAPRFGPNFPEAATCWASWDNFEAAIGQTCGQTWPTLRRMSRLPLAFTSAPSKSSSGDCQADARATVAR